MAGNIFDRIAQDREDCRRSRMTGRKTAKRMTKLAKNDREMENRASL